MPSYQVTLLPSQHQFYASSKQSILHAGLEAGLNLRYGCDGGNCGECMARRIEGEIEPIRHSDYVYSASEKQQQAFLSCCYAAVSDITIEMPEIGNVQELCEQRVTAKVYKMQPLSDSVMAVFFKMPRSQPLHFLAGQYVRLKINDKLKRNKSIASCPCDSLKPEFHIQRNPGDPFSDYVYHHLKKGDQVEIKGPCGNFVLDGDSNRPLVLIAFDTGFASIKSLIEQAIALEKEQLITLYWILTPGHDAYLENYCRSLQHALDNFSYQVVPLDERSDDRVSQQLQQILAGIKAARHSDIYVTLPVEFRKLAKQQLTAAGIDDRHWRIDTIKKL